MGHLGAETSQILDGITMSNRAVQAIGRKIHKTCRIYVMAP